MVKKAVTESGKPVLLIKLPAMIDDDATGMGIAITTDEKGNVKYNTMIDRSFLT